MKYPKFKFNSRPTPETGMVCDTCNELFWKVYCSDKIYRCSCGQKLRFAKESEKKDAETFIEHLKYNSWQYIPSMYNGGSFKQIGDSYES